MTTTQSKAIKAYLSARKLNSQDVSPKLAKTIFELFRALQPVWDFQAQEERKIFDKHPNADVLSGSMKIQDPDNPQSIEDAIKELSQLNEELKELGEVETSVDFKKLKINVSNENLKFSGEDIANLEPFVEFE